MLRELELTVNSLRHQITEEARAMPYFIYTRAHFSQSTLQRITAPGISNPPPNSPDNAPYRKRSTGPY